MWKKLKLGGIALEAMRWAADVARSIDPDAALAVVLKVVEIERGRRGIPGHLKLTELLSWFAEQFPRAADTSVVIGYVNTLVRLFDALGVFRKAKNA
jgi:hypothetical protein